MTWQTVSLPFGAGIDTKSDPKMSDPPELLTAQDCIFTQKKRLIKRNGYIALPTGIPGGGTLTAPQMVASYRNELLAAGVESAGAVPGQRLLSYSPSLTRWVDRGKYTSIAPSKTIISALDWNFYANQLGLAVGNFSPTFAFAGNIGLFVYTNPIGLTSYFTVKDLTTGASLEQDIALPYNAPFQSQAILLGSSQLAVLTLSNGTFYLQLITVTALGAVIVEVPIPFLAGALGTLFDIQTTSAGANLAYFSSAFQIVIVSINPLGVFGSLQSFYPPLTSINSISLTIDASGNSWVFFAGVTGSAPGYYYAIATGNPVITGLLLSPTLIQSLTALQMPTVMSAVVTSSTTQTLYYSYYTEPASFPAANPNATIYSVSLSTTAAGTPHFFLQNASVYSRPVAFNNTTYLAVMFLSASQPTGFLIDLADGLAVAKFLPGSAEGLLAQYPFILRYTPVSLYALSSTVLGLAGAVILTEHTTQNPFPASGAIQQELPYSVLLGVALIQFDFAHIDSFQSVVENNSMVLNGGLVMHYDGAAIVELGFSVYPDGVFATIASTPGTGLPQGTYIYYWTYEWTDANGNLHQSAPSIPLLVTIPAGGTYTVTVQAETLQLTQKYSYQAVLWRTQNAGQIAYRVNQQQLVNPSGAGVSLIDFSTDAQILATGDPLYTEGGAILENLAPPAAMILWTGQNRVWCVDCESPNDTLEYSKTSAKGTGISFSTGLLETLIDAKLGPISGASVMDEKTVIFKQQGLGFFYGDGANDSGSGSTITPYQFIPSDGGCTNSKSVIAYPGGILYRTLKGIYNLSRGVQSSYFGQAVEAYNAQTIQSAVIVPSRNQIRFLTSVGVSLLYDYVMGQWSIFTNHLGLSACIFNGNYVYARVDQSIFQEDTTGLYTDNGIGYSPLVTLSWIKATSIQGWQRTRRIMLLGDFQNANGTHGVQVTLAYDWGSPAIFAGAYESIPYYFSGANGPFQFRERLAQQKCDSFQITLQELGTPGASGEFIDFSDLSLEIMAKTGMRKLPASASVG
jgi:hypothetical protein